MKTQFKTATDRQALCKICGAVTLPHNCPHKIIEWVKIRTSGTGGI